MKLNRKEIYQKNLKFYRAAKDLIRVKYNLAQSGVIQFYFRKNT